MFKVIDYKISEFVVLSNVELSNVIATVMDKNLIWPPCCRFMVSDGRCLKVLEPRHSGHVTSLFTEKTSNASGIFLKFWYFNRSTNKKG